MLTTKAHKNTNPYNIGYNASNCNTDNVNDSSE